MAWQQSYVTQAKILPECIAVSESKLEQKLFSQDLDYE